ncbi:very short patch repair endonuclease [Thalassovita sp.]|uniref:very short patch repair endonuclease n=1 Tax=Thalassovita sp. TaxID=1979401 RepID=UPI003B5A164E
MADIVSPDVRSRMMSANKRRDTKPELLVRRYLHAQGFRFRLDVRKLPGRPDIVLARHHVAIFVHGCYWHRHRGCRFASIPKSNSEFWQEKFDRNVERDSRARDDLLEKGWRVAVVWECALAKNTLAANLSCLASWIHCGNTTIELPDADTAGSA